MPTVITGGTPNKTAGVVTTAGLLTNGSGWILGGSRRVEEITALLTRDPVPAAT